MGGQRGAATDADRRPAARRHQAERLDKELWLINTAVMRSTQAFALTDREGHLLQWNGAFERLTGYGADELRGLQHGQLTPVEWHAEESEHIRRLLENGESAHYEKEYRRKDGSQVPVGVTVDVCRDDRGEYLYAFITDLTERNRRTEALARSNRDLEQFAYIASHDLQEPLRAIAGCVQLLQLRLAGQLDEGADELIQHVVDGAHRMQALVNGLLEYSRRTTRLGVLQEVDTEALLANALLDIQPALEESGGQVTHDRLPSGATPKKWRFFNTLGK